MLPTVKIGGSLAQNASFSVSTCLVSRRLCFCGVAVSMGEAGKPVLFQCFQAGCHVVLRGTVSMRCDARDFAVEKKRKFMRNVVVLTFDSVNTLISNDLVNTPE